MTRRALVITCGWLALLVAAECWLWPCRMMTEPCVMPATLLPPPRATNIVSLPKMPPAELFEQVAAKPLFAPSRRPEASPASATRAMDARLKNFPTAITLRYVVVAPGIAQARLHDAETGRDWTVELSDWVAGWRVTGIDARGIQLRRAGDTTLLEITGISRR